jgi:hypothetical protein
MVNDRRSDPLQKTRRCAAITHLQMLLLFTMGMKLRQQRRSAWLSNVKPQIHSNALNTTRS